MSDAPTLDQRLNDLEARLDDAVSSAKKRRTTMTVIFVILAIFMAAYLFFAYTQIKKTDASAVVALAETQAEPYLNRSASAWAEDMKKQAPELINLAAEELKKVPDQMSEQVVSYVDRTVEKEMPQIEEEFKELVLRLVNEAAVAKDDNLGDGEFTDAEAKEISSMVSQQFESSLTGEINKLYNRYSSITNEMISHLERLAEGQDLDEQEELHRELIVNFLALMSKVQKNPPAGSNVNVLPSTGG